MKNSIIKETILLKMYEAHFASDTPFNVLILGEENHWDEPSLNQVIDRTVADGLIAGRTAGGHYLITPSGILYAEENRIVPRDVSRKKYHDRMAILDALEKHKNGDIPVGILAQETNLDQRYVALNLRVLGHLNYAKVGAGGGLAKISDEGLKVVAQYRA